MSASFSSSPFGSTSRPRGRSGADLWESLGQLRETFEQRVGTRMGRGDVRAAVLATLAVQPMHGYQIIRAIEERSGGAWKPSPGSVYPTLQLLADEGLVTADEADGRKTYSLTEAGRAEAEAAPTERSTPWEMPGMRAASRAGAIPKAGAQLAQAAAQIAQHGTSDQVTEAVAALDEARKKLYTILAQD